MNDSPATIATQRSKADVALTGRARILQILRRITFGVRPGDLERVERIGLEAYVDRQLHPERIDDSEVEARVRALETLDMTPAELVDRFPPPQLAKRLAMEEGQEMAADGQGRPREILVELARQELWRAVYSERQLEEVMVQFWMNHFNVFAPKGADKWLITSFEQDTIRPRALGHFEDLLVATAKSPAMLFYLDNWLSTAPGAPVRGKNRNGLNENYGRELMELHTLGVDGGYTQADVTEVARAFTGWTLRRPRRSAEFTFDPRRHAAGDKIVLGDRVPAGDESEGLAILRRLAADPRTARFLATKLCRRFVADEPPPALVDRAARRYLETHGDVREVVRMIVLSPELSSRDAVAAKMKSPLELVGSALRELGGETDARLPLMRFVGRMGQPMFQFQGPTG